VDKTADFWMQAHGPDWPASRAAAGRPYPGSWTLLRFRAGDV